jgi:phage/plasmid-like protein (TIGR03299 family)
MSHELTIRESGMVEMAYREGTDVPWHASMTNPQTFASDAPIADIIAAAGMDWTILRSFVRYAVSRDPDAPMLKMDDKQVLFRSDNKFALGVVSDNFKIVQPRETAEFFDGMIRSADFTLETLGTLFGGRRFWTLAAIGESASIADPRDKMKRYLMLTTTCDGTGATEGYYLDTRVVCNNTISVGMKEGSKRFRLTHRSTFNANDCRAQLGVDQAHETFHDTMDGFRRLADTRLTDQDSLLQTAELFRPGAADLAREDLMKLLRSKPVARVAELSIDGKAIGSNMDGMAQSQYGWLNAVTQYVDHEARARSEQNRFNSAYFGKGDELKHKAHAMAMSASEGKAVTTYETFRVAQGAGSSGLLDQVLDNMPSHV